MKVVFMGSPAFAVPALEALLPQHEVVLVVTQPDKPAGRGRKLVAPAVKQVAQEAGIPVSQPRSARDPAFAEELQALGADIGVVVAYGKILPKEVLDVFPHGCLNIHGSVLPRYRGAAPIQRSIMAGDAETGVTIMQLDEGMDTGPMLRIAKAPIAAEDTVSSLSEKLSSIGATALMQTLEDIRSGQLEVTAQDDSKATHAAMLSKEEGQVSWDRPARLVSAHIRGVDPWPGAYSFLDGTRLKLFVPVVVTGEGEAGTIIAVGNDGITVACGEGACLISEVQAPGKKRMSAADFARGRSLKVGSQLRDGK